MGVKLKWGLRLNLVDTEGLDDGGAVLAEFQADVAVGVFVDVG